MLAWQIVHT